MSDFWLPILKCRNVPITLIQSGQSTKTLNSIKRGIKVFEATHHLKIVL